MRARGRVYKRRGLEAALATTWAALWGTEARLWAGRCYGCTGDEAAARFPGRTQREAMARLCEHLRTEHGGLAATLRRLARLGTT